MAAPAATTVAGADVFPFMGIAAVFPPEGDVVSCVAVTAVDWGIRTPTFRVIFAVAV